MVESSSGASELEGPEEAGSLSEVRSAGEDLVDDVLNAKETVLAKGSLDDAVVSDGNALLVNVGKSALVDELADSLEGGVAEGDVGLDDAEHLKDGLGETNEDTVVELAQAQQLQDLAGLGAHVVDTADANHESDLGLRLNEEGAGSLSITTSLDQLQLTCTVLLGVSLSTLEDDLAGVSALLRGSYLGGLLVGELLGLDLLTLKHSLGDGSTQQPNQKEEHNRKTSVSLGLDRKNRSSDRLQAQAPRNVLLSSGGHLSNLLSTIQAKNAHATSQKKLLQDKTPGQTKRGLHVVRRY